MLIRDLENLFPLSRIFCFRSHVVCSIALLDMLKNLSNFFGRRSSQPSAQSSASPSQEPDDELALEVVDVIQDVKCFLADGKMQVALFGSPSDLADGWLRNCPWDEVFATYPNLLPLDQRLSLQDAQALVPFVAGFFSDAEEPDADPDDESDTAANDRIPAVAFRDWVQDVSETSGFEAKQVKRVAKALAAEMQQRIDSGDSFKLGSLRFRTRPVNAIGKRSGFICRVSRA